MRISKNIKRLIIFLIISFTSIAIILFLTVNENTFTAIGKLNIMFLFYCLIIWFAALTIDATGIMFFIHGTGEKIRFRDSYKVSIIRVLFNLITPFTFGGQPFMVYVLKKYGIPGGKGSTVVITRLLCFVFFHFLQGIITLIIFSNIIQNNTILRNTFFATIILLVLLFVFLILVMLYPPFMKKIIRIIGIIGNKLSLIKDLDEFNKNGVYEIYNMRNSFIDYFRKHYGHLLAGFLSSALYFLLHVIIILVIINGLRINMDITQGLTSSALLLFLIAFMPTPGSSGLGEGIFVLIFRGTIPIYLIGIVIILWRFFYQYLTALLGVFVSARFFIKLLTTDEKIDPGEKK